MAIIMQTKNLTYLPIVTARVLSLVRYSMHGATVNPDPSNRTLCAIGTDTFGPNALALASSCLRKGAQTETK